MQDLIASSIKYQQGTLTVLDQYLLPHQQHWHVCNDVETMKDLILTLKIRGAPLIGLGASLLVAHLAEQGMSQSALAIAIDELEATRPTAVNLMHCMAKLRVALAETDYVAAVVSTAEQLFKEDIALCDSMAERGAALVDKGDNILTHCNTGALATAGVGTALGVIRHGWSHKIIKHVYADETRPWLQGSRLTAWELQRDGISVTLNADSAAAHIMKQGDVKWVVVGADRITANGDAANKIGTYSLAVLARYHCIKFMVVAPSSTVDMSLISGDLIPIEERTGAEVTSIQGIQLSPDKVNAFNPVFDVTPAELIDAIVTEQGVVLNPTLEKMKALFG